MFCTHRNSQRTQSQAVGCITTAILLRKRAANQWMTQMKSAFLYKYINEIKNETKNKQMTLTGELGHIIFVT